MYRNVVRWLHLRLICEHDTNTYSLTVIALTNYNQRAIIIIRILFIHTTLCMFTDFSGYRVVNLYVHIKGTKDMFDQSEAILRGSNEPILLPL